MPSTNIDAQIRALAAPKNDSDLCLLSLDGGGVRGLSSLIILQTLMKRVNAERQKKGRETVKPCQIFDLIGGTSTGGLIAILLGRLELDIDDCIAYYKRFMGSIFSEKKHWFKANIQGKIQNQYDQGILKERIIEVLKERDISETEMFDDGQIRPSRTFVVAVRYENKNKVAIRDYTPDGEINHDPATIVQAALATSAASTFFPEVDINGKRYADGGLRANNPVGVVWEQALDIWSPEDDSVELLNQRIKCFVSVGTGVPDYKAIRNSAWGFLTETLTDLCTDTEDKAEGFAKQHRDLLRQDRYFRFNVLKGLETVGLEEFEKTATIETASADYLDGQETKLKREKCSKALSTKERLYNLNDFS